MNAPSRKVLAAVAIAAAAILLISILFQGISGARGGQAVPPLSPPEEGGNLTFSMGSFVLSHPFRSYSTNVSPPLVFRAQGEGCDVAVEKRTVSAGGEVFEAFSRMYAQSVKDGGEGVIGTKFGPEISVINGKARNYTIFFCGGAEGAENSAFILSVNRFCASPLWAGCEASAGSPA